MCVLSGWLVVIGGESEECSMRKHILIFANKKQDFGKNNAFFADIFRNVVF